MMQKITFTYTCETTNEFAGHCGTSRKLTVELPGDITLEELIEQFEHFTRGIGYFPPEDAHLEYVDNDTKEPKSIS